MPTHFASRFRAWIQVESEREEPCPLYEFAIQGTPSGYVESFVQLTPQQEKASFTVELDYASAYDGFEAFIVYIQVDKGQTMTKVYGRGPRIPNNRWFLTGTFGGTGDSLDVIASQTVTVTVRACSIKPDVDASSGLLYMKDVETPDMSRPHIVQFHWFYLSGPQFLALGLDPVGLPMLPIPDSSHHSVNFLRAAVDACWSILSAEQQEAALKKLFSTQSTNLTPAQYQRYIRLMRDASARVEAGATAKTASVIHAKETEDTSQSFPSDGFGLPEAPRLSMPLTNETLEAANTLAQAAATLVGRAQPVFGSFSSSSSGATVNPASVFAQDEGKTVLSPVRSPSPQRKDKKRARRHSNSPEKRDENAAAKS